MKYFNGEIKHLDGFKFNGGESVKFFASSFDHDDDVLVTRGSFVRRASSLAAHDIYDPATMCSNFYDGVTFTDKRSYGKPIKIDEQAERARIRQSLQEQDDWDD